MPNINIARYFPEAEIIVNMSAEDLAIPMLKALRVYDSSFRHFEAIMLPGNFQPGEHKRTILMLMTEAFEVLKSLRFVVPCPPDLHDYVSPDSIRYIVSYSGKEVDLDTEFSQSLHASVLHEDLIHPAIKIRAYPTFLRGDYETAVLLAMKKIEVSVREASKQEATLVGVNLMRKAFRSESNLIPDDMISAERQALCELFSGAMGYLRNSTGHRDIDVDCQESARVLCFASFLLTTLDKLVSEIS